jgi:site-specific recombinase XerD
MNLKISFIALNSRRKLNQEVPIYCYLASGRDSKRFATNLSIHPQHWDAKKQRGKGKSIEAELLNRNIEELSQRIKNILYSLLNANEPFGITDITSHLNGKKESRPTTLMAIYKIRFEKIKLLIGKDYQKTTLVKFTCLANAVQEYLKDELKVTDISLNKLNRVFIEDLELYLRANRSMKAVSINKITQTLKSIVRYCQERGWIDKDPFIGHKAKPVKTEIIYLSMEQVTLLENTILAQVRLNRVKEMFLFSVYTGLHFADAMSLTESNIVKGIDSNPWIDYIRGKTGKRIQIPLLNKAQALLVKFRRYGLKEDYLIPRITNQKLNSYLKEIADIVGIEVPLTHKIARKTFGSILLFNNVPIKVVSELMGHSNSIITEKHYAKLDTRKLGEAMKQLE